MLQNKQMRIEKEIVLVDDFSIDGTREILIGLNKNRKIIFHERNMGKGAAIKTAIKHSTGDILVIQDADLEYDPQDFARLIKPILDGKTNVVYGSRMSALTREDMHTTHYFGNVFLSFVTSLLYGQRIKDMETCYKMFRKEVVKDMRIKANRFDLEPEITSKILNKGYRIMELPISFNPRSFAEGKKITWKDGMAALYTLFKCRIFDKR